MAVMAACGGGEIFQKRASVPSKIKLLSFFEERTIFVYTEY